MQFTNQRRSVRWTCAYNEELHIVTCSTGYDKTPIMVCIVSCSEWVVLKPTLPSGSVIALQRNHAAHHFGSEKNPVSLPGPLAVRNSSRPVTGPVAPMPCRAIQEARSPGTLYISSVGLHHIPMGLTPRPRCCPAQGPTRWSVRPQVAQGATPAHRSSSHTAAGAAARGSCSGRC